MWYLRALGAAAGLALFAELMDKRKTPLLVQGEPNNLWDRSWSHEQHGRGRRLWPDCLLLAQLARPEGLPQVSLVRVAEAAFAATWAALSLTAVPDHKGCQLLVRLLAEDAQFLSTIKSEEGDNQIEVLMRDLLLSQTAEEGRPTVWAWKIGAWLQRLCELPELHYTELVELGWPVASFGLGFWDKEDVQYRRGHQLFKLTQPFERKDAFALLGRFEVPLSEVGALTDFVSVLFACSAPTKGLKEPPLWRFEALLGSVPGVHLTQTGYVHKQFDAPDMPEWLEGIRVCFNPDQVSLTKVLETLWNEPEAQSDLVFLETHPSMLEADLAFRAWQRENPCFGLPREVEIRTSQWFELAESSLQKSHLRKSRFLSQAFGEVDLRESLLATKVNAFVAGFGTDNDVVLESARNRLSEKSTYILRTVRKYMRWC